MQDTLIDQGISLMLYGMGTVFVFLTILVFATGLMSKVVRRLNPEDKPIAVSTPTLGQAPNQPTSQILEAIKSAIAEHRKI